MDDPVILSIQGRLNFCYWLGAFFVLHVIIGAIAYRTKNRSGKESADFSLGALKMGARGTGSIVLITAVIWPLTIWHVAPSYHEDGHGARDVSSTIKIPTVDIGDQSALVDQSGKLRPDRLADNARDQLAKLSARNPSVVQVAGHPAAFDWSRYKVTTDEFGKASIRVGIISEAGSYDAFYDAKLRDKSVILEQAAISKAPEWKNK